MIAVVLKQGYCRDSMVVLWTDPKEAKLSKTERLGCFWMASFVVV